MRHVAFELVLWWHLLAERDRRPITVALRGFCSMLRGASSTHRRERGTAATFVHGVPTPSVAILGTSGAHRLASEHAASSYAAGTFYERQAGSSGHVCAWACTACVRAALVHLKLLSRRIPPREAFHWGIRLSSRGLSSSSAAVSAGVPLSGSRANTQPCVLRVCGIRVDALPSSTYIFSRAEVYFV